LVEDGCTSARLNNAATVFSDFQSHVGLSAPRAAIIQTVGALGCAMIIGNQAAGD